ncbi:hypothetical protein GCM10010503_55650 [Streptomyces lucensis JCM 4490]|uniref:Secreted protein n=1 Tax=Streptomyces lucensis JCM 4490 TaxID=1306176 RepID=A0A918JDG3_9ACTN|nr:hypothetical protein [Streptomyces lucensis]GGW71130.1 hypothetical protein GCM10010503_55650 [Streptomyces lucensis JCM 4490]
MRGSLVGTAVTLAAGAMLTAAMTTASAGPPDTSAAQVRSTQPVLVDCSFQRNVRPADFILACGDGNSRLLGLHWTEWSPRGAVAEGLNAVNDCKPYCAAGKFHSYRVTVRLDRPAPWKKDPGVDRFTRMRLTYENARPEGFDQVVTYPLWG